jgi:Thoeris protein ThsB, TIR-like domain
MNSWPTIFSSTQPAIQKPPRKVFFSFHYQPDVHRAFVVRNSWLTKEGRAEAGFFDASVFEAKKRESKDSLKSFLRDGMNGTTVTCVLIGSETALRPWVRYELVRSFYHGNGLFAVRIHNIKNLQGQTCLPGMNPFDQLAYRADKDRIYWQEMKNGTWSNYDEVPSMPFSEVAYDLKNELHHTFSCRFPVYDWVTDNGYQNLGTWIQSAANQAGK